MKKKHLNGKLSLKVKDLSALDGHSQGNVVGGKTADAACEFTRTCPSGVACNTATNYAGCTIAGNSVNMCFACAPTYEYQTCPPNNTCGAATCSPSCTVYPNC